MNFFTKLFMNSTEMKLRHAFETLDLPYQAPLANIRSAYRKLALQYHPDKTKNHSGSEQAAVKFQSVQEAYEMLSNEDFRMLLAEKASPMYRFKGFLYQIFIIIMITWGFKNVVEGEVEAACLIITVLVTSPVILRNLSAAMSRPTHSPNCPEERPKSEPRDQLNVIKILAILPNDVECQVDWPECLKPEDVELHMPNVRYVSCAPDSDFRRVRRIFKDPKTKTKKRRPKSPYHARPQKDYPPKMEWATISSPSKDAKVKACSTRNRLRAAKRMDEEVWGKAPHAHLFWPYAFKPVTKKKSSIPKASPTRASAPEQPFKYDFVTFSPVVTKPLPGPEPANTHPALPAVVELKPKATSMQAPHRPPPAPQSTTTETAAQTAETSARALKPRRRQVANPMISNQRFSKSRKA